MTGGTEATATGIRRRFWTCVAAGPIVAASMFLAGSLAPEPAHANTVPIVSAGVDFTCTLMPSGAVFCSGRNIEGEQGQGTTSQNGNPVPLMVQGLPPAVAVSAGQFQACAIDQAALLWCWGDNFYGQLGDGTKISRSLPVPVTGGLKFAHVAAGGTFTCGITVAGAVWCWGKNDLGQLGDGTLTNSKVPVHVSALRIPAMQIAAGADRSACALLSDGSVKCWGSNLHGQLGDGTTTNRTTPVQVAGLTSGVTAVTEGGGQTCALLPGGAPVCWGENLYGEVGDGTNIDRLAPVPVKGVSTGVQQISAGNGHQTCALVTTSATVIDCWGNGVDGQVGDGIESKHRVFNVTQVFGLMGSAAGGVGGPVQVSAGGGHTCAVIGNGHVECWGYNHSGQIGDGTIINRATPTLVIGLTAGPQAISEGDVTGCALTQSLGAACWGSADGNDFNAHTSAVGVTALPGGVAQLAAGFDSACAISTTGTLRCWGQNTYGEVGNGTSNAQATPTQVTGPPSVVGSVSVGQNNTCALSTLNGSYCWGYNGDGEIGDGNTSQSDVPASVLNVGYISQISAPGLGTGCAISTTGRAYCWGEGEYGELGNGTTSDVSTPVLVTGALPARPVKIATGGGFNGGDAFTDFTCTVVLTGDVYCWGYNGNGQLGDGSTPDLLPHTSPVKVSLPGPARDVVGGTYHACALLDDGSVWCWGDNTFGELGNGGSPTNSSTPIEVTGLTSGVLAISASGSESTCALLASPAQVECWGFNGNDELGDGVSGGQATTPQVVLGL
jgi:alpha-tubulin suppressor-like RCC1 family protein